MKKNYLLTPGPTPIPPNVLKSLSQPIIHHRTPQFQEILKEVQENLKYTFQTKNGVFILASSGTGAMETAVCNIVNKGDKVLVIEGGKFGQRWTELNKVYGADVAVINVEWGKAVSLAQVEVILNKEPQIKAVYCTHCETSTGVVTDIKSLGQIVKDTNTILVVDAISSLGALDIRTDEWSIDIVVSGSQKGLMLPPGLGFLSVSQKAFKYVESCLNPRYYFDLRLAKKALDKNDTAFTPAITLIIGLNEVLKEFKKQGLESLFAKNKKLADATREAMRALGLELFADGFACDAVTSVKVPEGVDGAKLVKSMRDVDGVAMAGGQAHLKGKIFRIAHMGFITEDDLKIGISTLEDNLSKMGYKFEKGIGVKTFEKNLK